MSLRFTMLASGSGGNACLLEAGDFGLLLDAGLGPRQLAARLALVGASWDRVHALALTHTHSDHWHDRTLSHLHRRNLPLWCHPAHHRTLETYSPGFAALHAAGLVRPYEADAEFAPVPGLRCRPLRVRHDGGPTFAFRIEAAADLFGAACRVAYAADLGCWDDALADALADVDVLALEFNHDVGLEYASGRTMRLIARVLGDDGHLSNVQAAGLLREVLRRSPPGRLRHLVQLHLSRDCNRPHLAAEAALGVIREAGQAVEVHPAAQDEPGPTLHLAAGPDRPRRPRLARRRRPAAASLQPWLPGCEPG
jgi:phosphoribosyl 1,2-cyclic phosphodiesterase